MKDKEIIMAIKPTVIICYPKDLEKCLRIMRASA